MKTPEDFVDAWWELGEHNKAGTCDFDRRDVVEAIAARDTEHAVKREGQSVEPTFIDTTKPLYGQPDPGPRDVWPTLNGMQQRHRELRAKVTALESEVHKTTSLVLELSGAVTRLEMKVAELENKAEARRELAEAAGRVSAASRTELRQRIEALEAMPWNAAGRKPARPAPVAVPDDHRCACGHLAVAHGASFAQRGRGPCLVGLCECKEVSDPPKPETAGPGSCICGHGAEFHKDGECTGGWCHCTLPPRDGAK
jgi:outer membrane murein-binding lipoprotein Lpp